MNRKLRIGWGQMQLWVVWYARCLVGSDRATDAVVGGGGMFAGDGGLSRAGCKSAGGGRVSKGGGVI